MDDREVNIDLLFRNGLKDYEVLPPAEAWDKISPVIRKQQRPYIILRAAAMIAVLATLGFLTYTWNNEFSGISLADQSPAGIDIGTPEIEGPGTGMLAIAEPSGPKVHNSTVPDALTQAAMTESGDDMPMTTVSNPLLNRGLQETEQRVRRTDLVIPVRNYSKSLGIDPYPSPYTAEITSMDRRDRWTVAAQVSPTYLSSFGSGGSEVVRELGASEQPVLSYAGGVAFSYKVSRRLSVQSGLYYTSYGNELNGITSFAGFQRYDNFKGNSNFEIQTTNGTVYTNNTDIYLVDDISDNRMASYFDRSSFDPAKASLQYLNNSLMQNLGYLELPLILRYKLIDRAFDFNLIGGLSSNLLVNNSVYTPAEGGKHEVGKTEGLNPVMFSSSVGMGMEYNITNNLSFNLEPTFRYFLNPFSSMTATGTIHPYSFGIFSGLSYKF